MGKFNKKQKGGITIFLSIISLLIISLVGTTLEFSRIETAYTRANELSNIALDSCYSQYAKEVFEEYGLLMLWMTESNLKNNFEYYVDKNCSYNSDFTDKVVDFIGIKKIDTSVEEIITATYNDGELIKDQIVNYMKIKLPQDIISEIIKRSTEGKQIESDSQALEEGEIDKYIGVLEEEEEIVKEINQKIKIIKEDSFNFDIHIDNLISVSKKLEYKDSEICNDEVLKQQENLFVEDLEILENYVLGKISEIQSAKESVNKYYEVKEKENSEIGGISEDVYGVEENERILNNLEEILTSSLDIIEKIKDYQKEYADKTYYLNELKENFSEYDITGLTEHPIEEKEGEYQDEVESSILDYVDGVRKNGILNMITTNVSQKKISLSNLPSKEFSSDLGKNWITVGSAEQIIEKSLVCQYILDKFICYTDEQEEQELEYEIEYILEGKSSEKENLAGVADKLIAIREAANLLYLFTDMEKKKETYELAFTLVGATGSEAAVRVVQFLLMSAWAYAESIVDVRDLFDGYKVKMMKTYNDWNLSLMGIEKLDDYEKEKSAKEARTGEDYRDYLRILLFSQNEAMQIGKVMDLIQLNMQKKYNDNFLISECILGSTIYAEFVIPRLFSYIGFAKEFIGDKRNSFQIRVRQKMNY